MSMYLDGDVLEETRVPSGGSKNTSNGCCSPGLMPILVGLLQTYLQSASGHIEEMRVKRRDTEQWMAYRHLPEHIKERISRHDQYRWQETQGVDEEGLLINLPKDLRRDIKRHLCLSLLMRVLPIPLIIIY